MVSATVEAAISLLCELWHRCVCDYESHPETLLSTCSVLVQLKCIHYKQNNNKNNRDLTFFLPLAADECLPFPFNRPSERWPQSDYMRAHLKQMWPLAAATPRRTGVLHSFRQESKHASAAAAPGATRCFFCMNAGFHFVRTLTGTLVHVGSRCRQTGVTVSVHTSVRDGGRGHDTSSTAKCHTGSI